MRSHILKIVLRYVSLYLIVGLTLSSVCLWLFAELAEEVLEGAPITALDVELANALYLRATPLGTTVYRAVTVFGGSGIVVIGLVMAAVFVARRRWTYLIIWAIALVGGTLLNLEMKELFARPRPVFVTPLHIEHNFSFPSGHAMSSLITYGIISYFLWRETARRFVRVLIVIAAVLLIALIGLSRMALGVHYLTDVIGGFIAGGIWLGMCIAAFGILHSGEQRLAAVPPAPVASPAAERPRAMPPARGP
jgi:membrane-associated phospholipid phosphatase